MSVTAVSSSSPNRGRFLWRLAVLVILASIAALAIAQRRQLPAKPRLVGVTNVFPLSIRHAEGAWYWREQTKTDGERLMRISASGSQVVAQADALPCYALSGGTLAWTSRSGREWTVFIAASDGSQPHSVWKGTAEPMGIVVAEKTLYWLNRLPAPLLHSGAFPSLAPSLEVVALSLDGGGGGGKRNTAAHLWEAEDGEVLGRHANVLFLAAYRHTPPGSTCFYRLTLGDAFPVRIASERGLSHSLLTRNGVLYWTAPSKEVAAPPAAACLRRMEKEGHPETLSDWLPVSGELYETTQGVLYGDRDRVGTLWPAGRHDVFPESLTTPAGYAAIAAGEGLMLLAPANADPAHFTLSETPLP